MDGMLSFREVVEITRSWDSVYFLAAFVIACTYALWPSNKKKFHEAALVPLRDEEVE